MATSMAPDRPETGSDLQQVDPGELAPRKASKPILRHEIEEGLDALERPAARLFVSGLSAGLDLGLSHLPEGRRGDARQGRAARTEGAAPGRIDRFLLWATLGNTVGVVSVAFLKYGHSRPEAQTS